MNTLQWLSADDSPRVFPCPNEALTDPNGVLAAGGDLSSERLLSAYSQGIFPWYEKDQPILWWSPEPRTVLWPKEIRISRTLNRKIRRETFFVSADRAFSDVLRGCARERRNGNRTWITKEMKHAYQNLHDLGWAHSFEVWQDEVLIGGLYGVGIGQVFFGESMFSQKSDASKVALVKANEYLQYRGYKLIDCQIWSTHLGTLGARLMPRQKFLDVLAQFCKPPGNPGSWEKGFDTFSKELKKT